MTGVTGIFCNAVRELGQCSPMDLRFSLKMGDLDHLKTGRPLIPGFCSRCVRRSLGELLVQHLDAEADLRKLIVGIETQHRKYAGFKYPRPCNLE